tara:strand:- start:41 stop:322 length:282 start_codon:yes stop_codon:yes gene_type:complete
MTLAIQTNNQERLLIDWHDLTPKQQSEFDYASAEESQFVIYKGWPYDVAEFMAVRHNDELSAWDGYSSDSFFSGVLIKFAPDCDTVIMGMYTS